jgi:hypothetical protein
MMAAKRIGAVKTGLALLCLSLPGAAPRAQDDARLDIKPMKFGGSHEFGSLYDIYLLGDDAVHAPEWIDHFGSYFMQEIVVDGKLDLKAGIGGVFEYAKPELTQERFAGSQGKMFFVGPSVAEAMYHFGGVENGSFSIGGGMFPYKYNPDAANLGEYLFRSVPYPAALYTGALNVIGDNAAYLEGFKANFHAGGFSADALLLTETGLAPLYDWSVGLVVNYSGAGGLFEVGAGVNFKRLISIDSKKTTVDSNDNAYFQRGGKWYVGNTDYYAGPAAFYGKLAQDSARFDANTLAHYHSLADSLTAIADSLNPGSQGPGAGAWLNPATNHFDGAEYFSNAGTVVTARAALDLKKLFNSAIFGAQDLRLYGEVGILGVRNYPVYYDKITERMPIMAGFNLPAFGYLDLAAVQFEYFKAPYQNNVNRVAFNNYAIPYYPEGTNATFSENDYYDVANKDNYSWSILLRKTVLSCLSLNVQIARDHYRTIGKEWYYDGRGEPNEVLYKSSSWYWMTKLAWNI